MTDAPVSGRRVFFENLDGLRFLSAVAVVLYHGFYNEHPHVVAHPAHRLVRFLVRRGDLGVNFFFVLSGFLITYLLLAEQGRTGRVDLPAFYVRRVLRIWPLYLLIVAIGFLAFPLLKSMFGGAPQENASAWSYLLFLGNFDILRHGLPDASILGILWSIAVEEQFYVLWPVLLVVIPRRALPVVFSSIVLGVVLFRARHREDALTLYFHTLAVVSDMSIGGLCAYLCLDVERFREHVRRLSRPAIAAVYVVGALLIWWPLEGIGWRVGERVVLAMFFAFVIVEQNYAERSLLKVHRLRLATWWGKYTYGVYCWQMVSILIVITTSRIVGLHGSVWGTLLVEGPAGVLLTMSIAYLSYHALEKPFLRLKERFTVVPTRVVP